MARLQARPRPRRPSALKVGDFIGVQGTKQSDGTVTASSIVIEHRGPTGRPVARVAGWPGGVPVRSYRRSGVLAASRPRSLRTR